jgi:hypothetical protein
MATVVLNAPARPELDLRELMLTSGVHPSPAGGCCVVEAASVVSGEPWSDRPECVSPTIARFLRRWNDTLPFRPRQALKRYVCAIIDTRTTDDDEGERQALICDWLARQYSPAWLRLAGLDNAADALSAAKPITAGSDSMTLLRPLLWSTRRTSSESVQPDSLDQPFVRRAARESAWDAAVAALLPEPWEGVSGADRALVLDTGLMSLVVASRERVWPVAAEMRRSAHDLVERMCAVGRRDRQGWAG